jgi:hypothetical protein
VPGANLLRHLRKHGCHLKREGRSHSRWTNPMTGAVEATPPESSSRRKNMTRAISPTARLCLAASATERRSRRRGGTSTRRSPGHIGSTWNSQMARRTRSAGARKANSTARFAISAYSTRSRWIETRTRWSGPTELTSIRQRCQAHRGITCHTLPYRSDTTARPL